MVAKRHSTYILVDSIPNGLLIWTKSTRMAHYYDGMVNEFVISSNLSTFRFRISIAEYLILGEIDVLPRE